MDRPRFEVLDSLRGVCACVVVFHHIATTGWLTNLPIAIHGWLFVDFFFVLSGFVISASYGQRLIDGFPVGRFMTLRLGRVYPVHLVVLAVMFALELKEALAPSGFMVRQPFSDPRSVPALLAQLGLVHIFLGNTIVRAWNEPSWSIAAEVWVYLVAALALRFGGRFRAPMVVVATLACGVVFALSSPQGPFDFVDMAFPRCVYGFGLGMIAWRVLAMLPEPGGSTTYRSVVEVGVVAACVALVSVAVEGPSAALCPPLFVVAILVFARERGVVSRLLLTRPFRFAGRTSYSIYMVHLFIVGRFVEVLDIAGRKLGLHLASRSVVGGHVRKVIDAPGILPDLLAIVALLIVLAVAWASYRFVETPMRNWSRVFAGRRGARNAEAVAPAM